MASLTWEEIVEIDEDATVQESLEQLEAANFPVTSWQEGDPSLLLVEEVAVRDAKLSRYAVFLRDSTHSTTATKTALTKLSKSRFGNTRNPATPAYRTVVLACSAAEGPYSINLGDVALEAPSDGDAPRIVNDDGLSVSYPATLSSGGTLTLLFRAEQAGTDANLPTDSYTQLITTLAGVTVTSDTLTTPGTDEESDERLKARNATTAATKSLLPIKDAITNLALEAAPSVAANGVGIDDQNPRGAGTFDLYLATALGAAAASDVAAVQAALDLKVMGDTTVAEALRPGYAQPAPTQALAITGTVYYEPEFEASEAQESVEAALTAWIQTIPLGGVDVASGLEDIVPLNDVENAIEGAAINGVPCVRHVALSLPAGNTAVGGFKKVTLGTLTITYTAALS